MTALIRNLLAGQGDEPAEALQLLLLENSDSLSLELGDDVARLVDHPDYAVAEAASILADRWKREAPMSRSELPAFYSLILKGEEDFEQPGFRDPESGAMRIENPLGWTAAFGFLVEFLSKSGVSDQHIRHRCRMFIEQWGGLPAFGQSATDRLQADLRRLEMRMRFVRPHIAVAARALRYVAGELRHAGMIAPRETPHLLYLMGFPAPRLPLLSPAARPQFLLRPTPDESDWREREEKWLGKVAEDVRPLATGDDTVIAEVTRCHVRKVRQLYELERMRAPFLDMGTSDDINEWFLLLPKAIWVGGIRATSTEPARTIVRRFSQSYGPDVPEFMLTMCPNWLRQLGWRFLDDNWLIFVNRAGEMMGRIVWWRDGGPVDVEEDVIWGEGVYISLTPAARKQIESHVGPLAVIVNSRRELKGESGEPPTSRHATSRD